MNSKEENSYEPVSKCRRRPEENVYGRGRRNHLCCTCNHPIINLIAGIAAIVFAVISLVGLYSVGKDIAGCKTAFILTIVNLVISIVGSLTSLIPVLSVICSIAGSIISFLVVYYVCNSVAEVMTQVGAADIAERGVTVWKINLVCYVAAIVIAILAVIPVLSMIATVANLVIAIVSIIASILYMIFLNKSYQALGA